mmetsp:Transcript_105652/g.297189  ORF Transcript_105652/g.297189 Transcript_105652/m.297189 type:complete len:658 (+) Transcript_105652:62-2035(+)
MATTNDDWHLRRLCRRQLLQHMVQYVAKGGRGIGDGGGAAGGVVGKGGAAGKAAKAAKAGAGSSKRNHFIVLVVDALTVRIIQNACDMHDLLQEGVCLIEEIDQDRQALPMLEAIYFVAPTRQNVTRIVQDAKSLESVETDRKGSMYQTFHIFFSHRLPDDLLQVVASHPDAVARTASFIELNLSFCSYDGRAFHFGDHDRLERNLLEPKRFSSDDANVLHLKETAARLATLMVSIGETKNIFGKRGSGACDKLAREVRDRIVEVQDKTAAKGQPSPTLKCTLVILDRTFDLATVLAYDLRYEAFLYDALGVDIELLGENKCDYVDTSDFARKKTVLTPEKDNYFGRYRHLPLWEVNTMVADGIRTWADRDAKMRENTTSQSESQNGMRQMVASTLNAMQALPEHKETFGKLHVHSEICAKCTEFLEQQGLIELSTVMQDLICGVDVDANAIVERSLDKTMLSMLRDPMKSADTKARLLLLYSTSALGATDAAASKLETWTSFLEPSDRPILTHPIWINARELALKNESALKKRRARLKAHLRSGDTTPRSKSLCRWEPWIAEIFEEAISGMLDTTRFNHWPIDTTEEARKPGVVVYVIGGVSLQEVRTAHDISKRLGIEAYVGGSSMLTPNHFLETLRRCVSPAPAERRPDAKEQV